MFENNIAATASSAKAADDAIFKDAWSQDVTGGAGQFPAAGLSAEPPAAPVGFGSITNMGKNLMQGFGRATQKQSEFHRSQASPGNGPSIDALPTTATSAAPTAVPHSNPNSTTSDFTRETPYVAGVNAAGDVQRSAERAERLAIDDTMTQDEQYRSAWQNEANGHYGGEIDKVAVAPVAAPVVATPAAPAAPAPFEMPKWNMNTDTGA